MSDEQMKLATMAMRNILDGHQQMVQALRSAMVETHGEAMKQGFDTGLPNAIHHMTVRCARAIEREYTGQFCDSLIFALEEVKKERQR